jgi:heme-degrading monooxygenase HmoA
MICHTGTGVVEPPRRFLVFFGICESFLRGQKEGEGTMHVRATSVHLQPDKVDEAIRIFQESVVPAAKQQAGFRGATLLVDRATGKGLSLTHWASEAEMKAGESSGYYQEQIAKFGPLLTAQPSREAFEVAVTA